MTGTSKTSFRVLMYNIPIKVQRVTTGLPTTKEQIDHIFIDSI